MAMLPKTTFRGADKGDKPHEPISEIHAHKLTATQIFVPTSESRHFTRNDAALTFHQCILPADERTPHPELVELEKDLLEGKNVDESLAEFKRKTAESEKAMEERERLKAEWEDSKTIRVRTNRFEFRFRKIAVESAGKSGRSARGVGWRYGAPFLDRKRGQVKIPTQIPALPRA